MSERKEANMVVDFQHHYIPVELAKKRGLYSETGRTLLQEGGLPATTMHQRLYNLELQLKDMDEAGVNVSVLSCLLGWSAPLDECRFINATSLVWHRRRFSRGNPPSPNCAGRSQTWGCAA